MDTLRAKVIHLARVNPELRPYLLPILGQSRVAEEPATLLGFGGINRAGHGSPVSLAGKLKDSISDPRYQSSRYTSKLVKKFPLLNKLSTNNMVRARDLDEMVRLGKAILDEVEGLKQELHNMGFGILAITDVYMKELRNEILASIGYIKRNLEKAIPTR